MNNRRIILFGGENIINWKCVFCCSIIWGRIWAITTYSSSVLRNSWINWLIVSIWSNNVSLIFKMVVLWIEILLSIKILVLIRSLTKLKVLVLGERIINWLINMRIDLSFVLFECELIFHFLSKLRTLILILIILIKIWLKITPSWIIS